MLTRRNRVLFELQREPLIWCAEQAIELMIPVYWFCATLYTRKMFLRKDKRLSSARKRLMSQLGKRPKQSSEEQSTAQREFCPLQETNFQAPSDIVHHSAAGNENPQSSKRCPAMTIEPEVSGLLLESDSAPPSSDSEYFPTPEKRRRVAIMQQPVESASLGKGIFVCLSSQVSAFLDQVNANMACRTPGCSGVYVPVRVVCEGLGGGLKVEIACNGCKIRRLTFDSSPMVESSRRTLVSLALQVAFYASGCTHAQYYRILKQSLGVQAVTCKPFYEMIKLVFPHVSDMLEGMGTEAMFDMKALPPEEIGSMQRAIVTGDGTWLTRGHFSKNHTYTIRNYMTCGYGMLAWLALESGDKNAEALWRKTHKYSLAQRSRLQMAVA